ncbi:MAG: hypothetical protein KJ958_06785 [Gammaproteobacteria bacterium]|nr:hypothetical protein [Gammaproteobacteria bacterium]MBU1978862.1 hypothetical protein [Gammaproteobacteria bacterium]
MQTIPNEFHRSGKIFMQFARTFLFRVALGSLCALAGLGTLFIGKQLDSHLISLLGEALILTGAVYAAWYAILAEFRALARLQRWGKFSNDC